METPFDNFISYLWQIMRNTHQQGSQLSDTFILVNNFSRIARVIYLNMVVATEKMLSNMNDRHKNIGNTTLTQEEWHEVFDDPIRCRLSYFQFIEHINRTGRVFKQKGLTLPFFARIYFFRNKMVEHWDDYLQFLSASTGDALTLSGKIGIPFSLAGISMSDRSDLQQEITDAFAQYGVTLPSLDGKWYVDYSNIIYPALEEIDTELRSYDKKRKIGIPEQLVTLLFKYSLPTPICDMEEYCKTLVHWLETLPLQ